MSEEVKATTAVAESHPLALLEAHLNGSSHNASAAVKAIEAWVKKEVQAAIEELRGSSKTLSSNKDQQV